MTLDQESSLSNHSNPRSKLLSENCAAIAILYNDLIRKGRIFLFFRKMIFIVAELQWSALISIQWRRLLDLSFDFWQVFFNYKFKREQRKVVKLTTSLYFNAVWKLGRNQNQSRKPSSLYWYIWRWLYDKELNIFLLGVQSMQG